MGKIMLKACPKCHGDVIVDWDVFNGWHQSCIQCGHMCYLDAVVETKPQGEPEKAKRQRGKAVAKVCA